MHRVRKWLRRLMIVIELMIVAAAIAILVFVFTNDTMRHSLFLVIDNTERFELDYEYPVPVDGVYNYLLQGLDSRVHAIALSNVPIEKGTVQAAWSYALIHTADGLDLPNYDQAAQLMMDRHPEWTVFTINHQTVGYSPRSADDDFNGS